MIDPVSRPRVLLVDDDEDVRYMTRVGLGFEGFDVVEAGDGETGLEAARAEHPDVVILDIMMPGMDGIAVLRAMRGEPELATLPVVLLTAKAGAATERDGWDAGATAYLTKPFTGAALAGTLRRLLDGGTGDTARARHDLAARLNAAADRATT